MTLFGFSRFTFIAILSFTLTISLSSCVTIIDATSEGPIQTDPGKRSFGGYWDDKQLNTIISVNLKKAHSALDEAHINVYSYNAVVLLTGETPSKDLRTLAGKTAREVSRVRQVYNEIQIGPNTGFISRAKDRWLKSKIKTKLLLNTDIDSGRVEVIVENKVVYLMGLLTQAQSDKITDVVRRSRGVKKVVRAIEYIEDA